MHSPLFWVKVSSSSVYTKGNKTACVVDKERMNLPGSFPSRLSKLCLSQNPRYVSHFQPCGAKLGVSVSQSMQCFFLLLSPPCTRVQISSHVHPCIPPACFCHCSDQTASLKGPGGHWVPLNTHENFHFPYFPTIFHTVLRQLGAIRGG